MKYPALAIPVILWYTKEVRAAPLYATPAKVSARFVTKFNTSLLDKTTDSEYSLLHSPEQFTGMRRLHDLTLPLTASQELTSVQTAVFSAILDLQSASKGALLCRKNSQEKWIVVKSLDIPSGILEPESASDWENLFQAVPETSLLLIEDIETEPCPVSVRETARQVGASAVSLFPLYASDGVVIAVILAFFPLSPCLSDHEGLLLSLYSQHASAALERARRWEVIQVECQEHQRQKEEKVYMAARARCLLWYADVLDEEDHELYLWWKMRFPAEEVAQGFLPLALLEGEAYKDGFYRLRLPEDRDACDALGTASVRAGRSYAQDFRCLCEDGSIHWLHEDVWVETVIPGEQWRVVGACTDVTERKQQEEALRESEQRLQAALRAGHMGVWDWNLISGQIVWSGEHDRLLGLAPGEFDGTYAGFERCVHPEDRASIQQSVQTALQEKKPYAREYRVVWPNGSIRWVKGMGEAEYNLQGQPIRMMGTILDITARKQAESEISDLNTRLRRAMAETHHRVKNNLQVIAALLDIQSSQHEKMVPTEVLGQLSRHIQGLATIHDLLTHQVKEGQEIHSLSARVVLAKLLPLLQETVGSHKIQLQAEETSISVQQGTALALITNELVSNAVKHGQSDILVTLTKEGEEGRLAVMDSGPGFPLDFDLAAASNTGLELVQNMGTWDMGGQVCFENRPEGGARVCLCFPLIASSSSNSGTDK